MIILIILIILVIITLTKLILYLIVRKHGFFSYDGFSAAGFTYNAEEDIFYSSLNAWQKNFGYSHLYDVLAPIFRMIIDTEPIRFNYNNKNWLITFWKGQYGIVTGAEVGIYCTKDQTITKNTVYLPVDDNEMLNMYLILYKKDKVITKVHAKHWWLAIFKLGMFSNPKDLSMDINITFPNNQMLISFLKSFQKLGYKSAYFTIIDNTFCFKYIKPRTRKVWTRNWLTDLIRQYFNRKNVELYNRYLADLIETNKIDDSRDPNNNLIMLNDLIPNFLKNTPIPNQQSTQITSKLINTKASNIAFLNTDIKDEIWVKKL